MIARLRPLVACLALGFLAACASPPPQPSFPDIRFTSETPLVLDAASIQIVTRYQPGEAERAFPMPPLRAVQNWAQDRLRAGGHRGIARFTITDASVTEKDLPVQGGLNGAFTNQVSQQYDIALDATLDLLDERGVPIRTVAAAAARSGGAMQSASPNERDQVRYDMVKALMADFDREMTQQIRDNFGLYLLSR